MSDQNAALFDKLDGFYVTKSEHDWLERRFSNMTEKEKILFFVAMELEKFFLFLFHGALVLEKA